MRCALCPQTACSIPPDGPCEKGGLLFVAEAPGPTEEKQARKHPPGRPLVGKTGDEVDRHYLPLAGLRRDDVTCHNAISCFPPSAGGKLDPKRAGDLALLDSCARTNLYPLIERMQPRLIIPMGNFACRAVLGESFNLEIGHGIPIESPYGMTFPMYHPALGLHEPKKMLYVRTDWDRIRKYLKGRLLIPHDDYAGVEDYQEVTDASALRELERDRPLSCDTESSPSLGPYCLTFSQYPGTGRLIKASRMDLVGALQRQIGSWEAPILFHNWLYDWSVTEAMGLHFPYHRLVDTMAVVYQLGNLPQGLKALAFRELGMQMHDFDDVVTPHSRKRVLEYYELASFEEWPKPDPQMVIDEIGQWKLYKPQSMTTKFKRFFTDYRKNPNLDVFERWENWEESHQAIEAVMGPWPGKDIAHVPEDIAFYYAIRDADALGRLWPIIKKMRTLVRKFSQESWRERAA